MLHWISGASKLSRVHCRLSSVQINRGGFDPRSDLFYKIGNSPTKTRAKGLLRSVKSFSTKRKAEKMQTTISKSPSTGSKDDDPPKLERQLTSNFDREMVVDDYDIEQLQKEHGVTTVEEDEDLESEKSDTKPVIEMPEGVVGPLNFKTGEATDIGGGHENQDKSMCFRAGPNNEHLIMAVFDGHGRDLGEIAAIVARDFMRDELQKLDVLEEIEKDATPVLENLFEAAHKKIKDTFRQHVEERGGWEVVEAEEGYLIKRQQIRNRNGREDYFQQTNVHGGTTATVAIILHGKRLIVANVGDSTALFGGLDASGKALYKELSAEHSPESIEEFSRVKSLEHFKRRMNGGVERRTMYLDAHRDMMSLRFVYDVIDRSAGSTPKHSCPPIFTLDSETGAAKRSSSTGHYYKNVRSEWATLVTTPPTAKFQDALAFTRSLGDLHLHVYGVTHTPEITEYDLGALHDQVLKDKDDPGSESLLLVCTDGVWDNWKYEDIIRTVLSSPLAKSTKVSNDAQQLTDEMMFENLRLARKYFGSQADNMTGIVCLIHADSDSANSVGAKS